MEKLLNKSEVADLLGVSERKVDLDRAAGLIACIKIGSKVRFEPAEVKRYVEAHRQRGNN